MKDMYIIPIFIPHMGCPFKCVFCNQNAITGQNIKIDEKFVRYTINSHLNTIPFKAKKEVSFFGGSFTGIPMEMQNLYLGIANEYLKDKRIDAIRLSTRPDYINNKILDNLKRFDVSIIELGVQSMVDDVLNKSHRGHTSMDVENAVKLIREYDFKLGLQIMPGLPGDNLDRIRTTCNKVIKLKPEFVRIYPTLVVKGTYLEKMYEKGDYIPLTLDEAINISKELYINFIKNDIDVIRIGLQPTENINYNGDVVAGPFHPSIGQLVESAVIYDILKDIFEKLNIKEKVLTIITNPKFLSTVIGQKKVNKYLLEKEFNIDLFFRTSNKLNIEDFALIFDKKIVRISKINYLKRKL
ncbi:MAG: elongator complex protein 3 [Thermoanaerobacteraceae bacterium]